MPLLSTPPNQLIASNTVTRKPLRAISPAKASPDGPEPTTATLTDRGLRAIFSAVASGWLSRSLSATKRSRLPIATAGRFILVYVQLASHCFSCGHTRPHTAGSTLVRRITRSAVPNSRRSIFFINPGMSLCTGQPLMQPGSGQSRQRRASSTACSTLSPCRTSSSTVTAYSGVSSGMRTRGIAVRCFAVYIALRSSRHGSLRLVRSSDISPYFISR